MNQFSSKTLSGSSLPNQPENPVALARVAEVVASVRASVEVAHMNPRKEAEIHARAMQAMTRKKTADEATYAYERGWNKEKQCKNVVTGPSVKLARELARLWGNMQYGLRIVSAEGNDVHIEGWAWDLESNTRTAREAKFSKLQQRKQKDGSTKWVVPDERDLDELIARRGAKLTRNAILELMPDFLIDDALEQADATLRAEVARKIKKDPEQQVKDTCVAFERWGVTRGQLEAFIGGNWDADGLVRLRQVYHSLLDGHSKVSEHFETVGEEERGPSAQTLAQTLNDLVEDQS